MQKQNVFEHWNERENGAGDGGRRKEATRDDKENRKLD
jgi:hypothetical protein